MKLPVSAISIGKRYRKDLGDLDGLAQSIRLHGLAQPLVLNSQHELVAGLRRLRAVQLLGWTEVEVVVLADLDDAVRRLAAEYAENCCRKEPTPSEIVNLTSALWALERKRARQRQGSHAANEHIAGGYTPRPVQPATPGTLSRTTRDAVAETVGISGRTLEKARRVVEAATEDPDQFAAVQDEMDRTGRVDPAYRQVRAAQTYQAARSAHDDLTTLLAKARRQWQRHRDTFPSLADLPGGQKQLLRPLLRQQADAWLTLLAEVS